jgi:hypothetical protein
MTPRVESAIHELVEALAESVRLEAAAAPAAPDRLLSLDEAGAMLGIGRSSRSTARSKPGGCGPSRSAVVD